MTQREFPNPLVMEWEERLAWYDGLGAVLGLMSLVTWMHIPPLCAECRCNDAVDLVDVYSLRYDFGAWSWDKRAKVAMCDVCVDTYEDEPAVVVPHGAEPHLLHPAVAADTVNR